MTLSQLDTSSTNTPKATCVSPQEHSGSNKNDAFKTLTWSNTNLGLEPDWSLYDAIEVHPLVNLNEEGEDTYFCIADDETDPEICAWCVYGHLKEPGGIEDLHDVESKEEALSLALYCEGQIEIQSLTETISLMANNANKGSGLVYEIFAQRFSQSINDYVLGMSEERKSVVISIARQYGYEENQAIDDCDDDSCCHGLDVNCCPLGCGEYDGYEEETTTPAGYEEAGCLFNAIERLTEQVRTGKWVNATEWSQLKQRAHKQPEAIQWYDTIFVDGKSRITTAGELIKLFKSRMLDARFEFWIESKVEAYKDEE
ncbi:hypothetical protein [Vibrio fluvialis]|uniref:hypothetical protein n=1 Tax=Vibrio fluvialis TaxID=676 RepID=UPI0039995EC3